MAFHPAKLLPIPQRNRLRQWAGLAPEADFLSPFERRHRCIFFHIPKTGGIAISESLLEGFHTNHRIYRRCAAADPVTTRTFWKFAIVRDPIDRFLSAYRFLHGGGINAEDAAFRRENDSAFQSVERFGKAFRTDARIRAYVHFRPQVFFLSDEQGNPRVDYAGRFEELDQAFNHIRQRLGQNVAILRHHNRTQQHPAVDVPAQIPDVLLDDLRAFYADDYTFIDSLQSGKFSPRIRIR